MDKVREFFASLRGYGRPFWVANISELFERLAFYGLTMLLVLFLTRAGLSDKTAMRMNGVFGLAVYGLPVFSGMFAEMLGYRRSLLLAYTLLASGYFILSQSSGFWVIGGALALVAAGASLVKPTITGTVQKTCSEAQRAVGFSIYYTLVNIGAAVGEPLAGKISTLAGSRSAFVVSGFSAVIALTIVFVGFRPAAERGDGERKSLARLGREFWLVVSNWRLMSIFAFAATFWTLFYALFNAFPLYVSRTLHGTDALVGGLTMIESVGVISLTVVVGIVTRHFAASRAVTIALGLGALSMAVIGLLPSIWGAAAGIVVLAFAEIIYSAHFYKYLGDQAPVGQVGMYMGFAFLPIAVGYLAAGFLGGSLVPAVGARMDLLWYIYAGIGLIGTVGMYALTQVLRPKAPAPSAA